MEFYCFANVSKFGGNFLWALAKGWDSINKVMYLIMKPADRLVLCDQWIQLLGNLLWPGQTNHKTNGGPQWRPKKAFYEPNSALSESVQWSVQCWWKACRIEGHFISLLGLTTLEIPRNDLNHIDFNPFHLNRMRFWRALEAHVFPLFPSEWTFSPTPFHLLWHSRMSLPVLKCISLWLCVGWPSRTHIPHISFSPLAGWDF